MYNDIDNLDLIARSLDRIEIESVYSSPVFHLFRKYIEITRNELMLQWSEGVFTGESADATAQLNAKALGMIQALTNLEDFIRSLPERASTEEEEEYE